MFWAATIRSDLIVKEMFGRDYPVKMFYKEDGAARENEGAAPFFIIKIIVLFK